MPGQLNPPVVYGLNREFIVGVLAAQRAKNYIFSRTDYIFGIHEISEGVVAIMFYKYREDYGTAPMQYWLQPELSPVQFS